MDQRINLLCNIFHYASRNLWNQIAEELPAPHRPKPPAKERFVEFTAPGGAQSPASSGSGKTPGASSRRSWTTTSSSAGSSAARMPSNHSMPATGARSAPAGISRTEQAAMKCLYLATRSLDPTGRVQTRWAMRWQPAALNARLRLAFKGGITPAGHQQMPRSDPPLIGQPRQLMGCGCRCRSALSTKGSRGCRSRGIWTSWGR
jgi:putative transposase